MQLQYQLVLSYVYKPSSALQLIQKSAAVAATLLCWSFRHEAADTTCIPR